MLSQTERVDSAQRLLEGVGIGSRTSDSDRFDPFRNALWEHMKTLYQGGERSKGTQRIEVETQQVFG